MDSREAVSLFALLIENGTLMSSWHRLIYRHECNTRNLGLHGDQAVGQMRKRDVKRAVQFPLWHCPAMPSVQTNDPYRTCHAAF
jgi:hypothetical protein